MNTNNLQARSLSPEEIAAPFSVIENFFQTWNLADCRHLLREIMLQAFSGYSSRESINPGDVLLFLEALEKVTEVMYAIGQQQKEAIP